MRSRVLPAALLGFLGGTPGIAGAQQQDDELDDLAEALAADAADAEEQVAQGGASQKITADLAFIGDFALAYFSDESLQTGEHDPSETGFALQQLELSVGAAVDAYFRMDGSLVYSEGGVEIEEIYGTTLALPHRLQARAGLFLTRFGRINSTHLHSWDFLDQPLAIGRVFGGEGNRGVGVELSWLAPLPWFVEVIGSVTDAAGEGTARSFFGAADLTVDSPLDFQATLAVKQFHELSANWSLLHGLSVAAGPNPTGDGNRTEVYGADLYIKYRPIDRRSFTVVALTAEVLYRRRQIPGDVLRDHTLYASLLWRFWPRWTVAARYDYGSPARQAQDYLDPEWVDHRHRVTAALSFFPTEFSRLRVQSGIDVPTWQDDPVVSVMAALELLIGAHGAHTF